MNLQKIGMASIIRYTLRDISPQVLRDLQEHYPDASVQIELSAAPANGGLSESDFWDLLNNLDWARAGDDNAVIKPLVETLASRPLRHIYDFADILSYKLYLLDGDAYANPTQRTDWEEDADFTADRFLYIRCCIIANGHQFFDDIRRHPEKTPHDRVFAPLLRVPNEAYSKQTKQSIKHIWAYPIETFSNLDGWPNFGVN